ncbi:putative glycolate oxidase/D-lactatate dehydrogenase, partial [Candidatus Gastranaerophilus sp. (ex Termes propinquus)]
HAGDGNIHPNFALDLANDLERENFEKLKDELFETAIKLGGTLSGEHGIGCEKKKYLNAALDGTAIDYMEKIKKLFDKNNIFNPYKMF